MERICFGPNPIDCFLVPAYTAEIHRKTYGNMPGITFERVEPIEHIPGEYDIKPKQELKSMQDGRMLMTLQRFIVNHCCVFRGQITARELHSAFQRQMTVPVSYRRLFPALMKEILRLLIVIRKTTINGKVTDRVEDLNTSRPSTPIILPKIQ